MKAYGEWSASRPGCLTPGTLWVGDWVASTAGLDDVEKRKFLTLPGLELGRPARSQSLYRLRYRIMWAEKNIKNAYVFVEYPTDKYH
jgi:hypothetical protein